MRSRWSLDPQYSHGFLVPVFALVLLWLRSDLLPRPPALATNWWGVVLLGAGLVCRFLSVYYYFNWLDGFSLLPTVAGLFLLFGGRRVLAWGWPAIAFLLFMLPLPFRVEIALSQPLRAVATTCSTYVLQTLGFPVLAEGNTILMENFKLGVEEACSGLSMLVTFFALTTAIALVSKKPLLDRALIVASAIPIALVANVTRITVTGIAHELIGGQVAHAIFHDWAGWFMMPLALVLLWLEVKCLDRLFVPRTLFQPLALDLSGKPA
jgi:exosortase